MNPPQPLAHGDRENESPEVPGFKTWRGIYWFVIAWFMLVVILLALFTRAFE